MIYFLTDRFIIVVGNTFSQISIKLFYRNLLGAPILTV